MSGASPGDRTLDALAAGATVITVNNRLARVLAEASHRRRLEAGERAWETPDAVPLPEFLLRCWSQQGGDGRARALRAHEARALWSEVLATHGGDALLATDAAARSAAEADALLLAHGATVEVSDPALDDDASQFAAWREAYVRRLESARLIDAPRVASALPALIAAGEQPVRERVLFAGFDCLLPQQQALATALSAAGCEVHVEPARRPSGQARRLVLPSPELEIEAAARWARGLLDTGARAPIGVVFPALAECLDEVEARFEDMLHPLRACAPSADARPRAFNVSLGRSLGAHPIVGDALAALSVQSGWLDGALASRVLRSPYLVGAMSERAVRLALEARLSESGVRRIGTKAIAAQLRRGGATLLAHALEQAAEQRTRARSADSLATHAERFAGLLELLGWPHGGVTLDSVEYQAAESWRGVLERLAALEGVLEPRGPSGALALLERLSAETLFQPRTEPAPVQVLGMLEAAALEFGSLWLAGMHDGAWPAEERPNPLLPIALQRRHDMPGASPQGALNRARRLTERLLAGADAVVVSHAEADADSVQRVSPLVATLPEVGPDELPFAAARLPDEALRDAAPTLERLQDRRARTLGHGWRAPGGSAVLTDQAACPFRAFARHRLAASRERRAPVPLDARLRGSAAHALMQSLFSAIRSHAALSALDDESLEAVVQSASDAALALVRRRHPGRLPARLLEQEGARLRSLARRWLAREAERMPFQVEALEQRRRVRVGGLALDLQIDRVDRVGDRRVLIDYKTGRASRSGWFGARPDEPQLPLYALALDSEGTASAPVAAVCFAVLRAGQESFEGVADEPDWAPGLSALGRGRAPERDYPDLAALKRAWIGVLTSIAEAFSAGDAAVDPKPNACRYCEQRALCRVDELAAPAAERAPGGR